MNTDFTGQLIAEMRYEVRKRLGTGSMGHVFMAWDNRLETEVVIKVPTLARLENNEFRERFLRESRYLVKLPHPRIVTILDVGEHEGVPYFVMQYIAGGSLETRIYPKPSKPVFQPLSKLKTWLPGTAEALDFMHKKGFIHRDIKPANILYDEHDNAYLSDFGLSKIVGVADEDSSMTAAGAVVGTPNYVAPEVVLGQEYDGRADQYSLAMTLYETLTGRCPLEGPTATATMVAQTNTLPPPPAKLNSQLPAALSEVVMQALSKSPDERFETCTEFATAVLEATGLSSDGSGVRGQSARSSARHNGVTDVLPRPTYTVVKRVKVKSMRAPCPKCSVPLKLQPNFAGRKGHCVQCKAPIVISRDLKEIRQVKLVRRGQTNEFDFEIGTELFGIKLTKQQALAIMGVLLLIVIGSAVAIGVTAATQTDETEIDPALKIDQEQRSD